MKFELLSNIQNFKKLSTYNILSFVYTSMHMSWSKCMPLCLMCILEKRFFDQSTIVEAKNINIFSQCAHANFCHHYNLNCTSIAAKSRHQSTNINCAQLPLVMKVELTSSTQRLWGEDSLLKLILLHRIRNNLASHA